MESKSFKIQIVTTEHFWEDEQNVLLEMLSTSDVVIRLRKKDVAVQQLLDWLSFFPEELKDRFYIHIKEPLDIAFWGVYKVHSSFANHHKMNGLSSVSVHSYKEARMAEHACDELLMSPVFTSISKVGYKGQEWVRECPHEKWKVDLIALGGVSKDNIRLLKNDGFNGAALLGYIWQKPDEAIKKLKELYHELQIKEAIN